MVLLIHTYVWDRVTIADQFRVNSEKKITGHLFHFMEAKRKYGIVYCVRACVYVCVCVRWNLR